MESFLNRYRNITVLLLVIVAQLMLLAVQVKNENNVRFIRVWSVTAISPLARVVGGMRGGSLSFFRNYVTLKDVNAENRKLKADLDRLKVENTFLKNEISSADRAIALQAFQRKVPSRTLAASVFTQGIGSSRKVVYVDRGSLAGVMREMAVINPDGILGKVTAVFPNASEVLLVTDPAFAAGVVSDKGHIRGTLKGTGTPLCKIDFVAFEDKVEPGDIFYTSGDDRIFPRGMPVGVVKSVRSAQPFKEITIEPAGFGRPLEDVLIVLEGVHQEIPDTPQAGTPVYLAPPVPAANPPAAGATADPGTASAEPAPRKPSGTEADKMRSQYQNAAGTAGIVLGGGPTGTDRTRAPDFTKIPVDPRTVGGRGGNAAPAQTSTPPAAATKSTAPPVETKGTAPATKSTSTPEAQRRANQAAGPGGNQPQ